MQPATLSRLLTLDPTSHDHVYLPSPSDLIHATRQPSGEWVKNMHASRSLKAHMGGAKLEGRPDGGSIPIVVPHTQGVMFAGLHTTGQRNEGTGKLKAGGDSLVPSGPLAMKTSIGSGIFPIQFVRLLN